jgi:hypothetical protein
LAYVLGTTRRGNPVELTTTERATHLHVLGASDTGKSKFLETLIRQDIVAGRGLMLIDPHGPLADAVIEWCASRHVDARRKVHVVTPADLDWTVGFNPLRLDTSAQLHARVDAMVAACAQVWGGENLASTPLLKRCLKVLFYTLAVRELTLTEAPDLLTVGNARALRRVLTEDLPDPVFDAQWVNFNALSQKDFLDQFSSSVNRLMDFLSSPVMRRILGQRRNVLDLRRAMDEGEIVIVNFATRGVISEDECRVLGTLLTSELFLLAKARTQVVAQRRPFTLYIDECYQYITSSIERMLDETRKFGLHLVLSHQRLGQLGDPNGPIYNGVMAGGRTKVVFGGLEDHDAEVMAKNVFRSSFNLERPKHVLDKPVVIDEVPYWLESVSHTQSSNSSHSSTSSSSSADTASTSDATAEEYWAEVDDPFQRSKAASASKGHSESRGSSDSDQFGSGEAWTQGSAQTLKPVRVDMPTAVYSLEEELHLAIVKLRELPKQTAIVKRPARPPVQIRPATVKPALVRSGDVGAFIERARRASAYVSTVESADAEIVERQAAMRNSPSRGAEEPEDPFWAEEIG